MTTTSIEFVQAPLKYLADDEGLAGYVASVGGGDATEHKGNYIMQSLPIYNGRARDKEFSLDGEGFLLISQTTAVKDFYNNDEVSNIYEDEVKKVVRGITGASRVEIFDHTRRSSSVEIQKEKTIRESASIIHNDYTAHSGPNRLRYHYRDNPEQAEKFLERRFAIVNIWRSTRATVHNAPLALCDATTTESDDLICVKREARDRIGEIQLALHNPAHRWYYFPQMQMDEALLIKTYDSQTDGRARFTLHTSFDDPNAATDAPQRESIETRCFVFF